MGGIRLFWHTACACMAFVSDKATARDRVSCNNLFHTYIYRRLLLIYQTPIYISEAPIYISDSYLHKT